MGLLEHTILDLKGLPHRGQFVSGITGTMSAALASGAVIWLIRYPAAATRKAAVLRVHQHYACIGAFTTPVNAGRRIHCFRGSGTDGTTGSILDVVRKHSGEANEALVVGRIATTSGVAVSGISLESSPIRRMMLTQAGFSGSDYDEEWRFEASADSGLLLPGQLIVGAAGQTFDAGGTWQLNLSADVVEL